MTKDSTAAPELSSRAVDSIVTRLAGHEDLWVPSLVRGGMMTKREYLHDLLCRDPGVFLERHGRLLTTEEIGEFERLRDSNYEVDFYLAQLNQPAIPTGSLSSVAKNRRFAKMENLMSEGTYFSMDEMRQRQPYLYHLHVGQYTKQQEDMPALDAGPYALAMEIMKQHDEDDATIRANEEQKLYKEMIDDGEFHGSDSTSGYPVFDVPDQLGIHNAAFLDCMQQLFLSGKETGIDYTEIDEDTSLDNYFDKGKTRDLEEAYFDADD